MSLRELPSTGRAVLAQTCAMLSFQYGATYAKGLYPIVGASGATALRLSLATLLLALALRPWRARVSRAALPSVLCYGATLALMNWSFYLSLRSIPLGIATAIEFAGPLVVAVAGSRRARDLLWLALALAGLVTLLPHAALPGHLPLAGVGFAIGAAVGWALYILAGRWVGQALGTQAVFFGVLVAAVLVLPFGALASHEAIFRVSLLPQALLVGLLSSALPYSLELFALTRLPTTVYGTLTSLEPALGALMGLWFLHEQLVWSQWLGIALVVTAAVGTAHALRPQVTAPAS